MELAEIEIDDFGGAPVAEHNMPCVVCGARKAVYELSCGRFQPCWGCQEKGWRTAKFPRWRVKLWRALGL